MDINCWVAVTEPRRMGGLLRAARSVSSHVVAAVVGSADLAQSAARAGFDEVLLFEAHDEVPAEALAGAVAGEVLATGEKPRLVIGNDAPAARVVVGAVAGALGSAVVGAAIGFEEREGKLVVSSEIAAGKAVEDVAVDGRLAAIYIGPDSEIETVDAVAVRAVETEEPQDRVVGIAESGGSGLGSALRVVGVGMGIADKGDLVLTDGLASALGAEIACTLPACDNMHWYTPDRVLGSSHNQAAPELYFAVGISGSPNHTSGFRDAKVVVSINSDADAEIFRCSTFGIVGDLYKVVPALTAALS